MNPQIQNNIHFRAFSHAHQFMNNRYREKEKANILLAWVVVLKRSIIGFPIRYMKYEEPVPVQAGIGDVILGLQKVQNADGLVLESGSEPG